MSEANVTPLRKSTKFKDLTGRKFGRLVVLRKSFERKNNKICWICRCDCGREITIRGNDLNRGDSQSCGCLHREKIGNLRRTHGMTGSTLYHIWQGMKQRCNYLNHKSFEFYGGRGIVVCDRWQHSFPNFHHDMVGSYRPGLSLERIDNNGPYAPENCRWTTHSQQVNNRRNTVFLTFNGERHAIVEWAKILGTNRNVLRERLKLGWPLEQVLTRPVRHQSNAR